MLEPRHKVVSHTALNDLSNTVWDRVFRTPENTVNDETRSYAQGMVVQNIGTFLEYFSRVRERTMRVVDCIPEDRLEWTFKPGHFTLGDLVRHLAATERLHFVEVALGRSSRYAGCGPELVAGLEGVKTYLQRNHLESVQLLSSLTDTDLRGTVMTPGGVPITVWKWLRLMPEHEIHHRGQLYMMLAMLDVSTPPIFGLTSEQLIKKNSA
jgi:uncharacterized damage-inducible protein DinB